MKEIGIILKEARESKGLDVEDAARELKIRPSYIEILESGDFSSVSNEIYLTGYLKSYANWLGIDKSKISKVKSGGSKLFVTDKVMESPSFFGFDDEMVSPGGLVTLVSLLLAVFIYTFWHKQSDVMVMPKFDMPVAKEVGSGGRNWAEGLAAKGDKFLLVAQEVVTLRIKEKDGEFINKQLDIGDIYFLSSVSDVVVESDNPAAIDVFADDGKSTFIGSLSSISEGGAPENADESAEKPE